MSSLVDKFQELERLILDHRETLALHAGVPFVLLVYDPRDERRCRDEQQHLKTKFEDRGLQIREIALDTFIFDHYAEIGLLEKVFEREGEEPGSVYRDLAKHYRPALTRHIVETATALEKNHEDAVLFLTKVAHLYPFVRVSNLLDDLENQVKLPVVVFYPGEELDSEIRFLCLKNADGPHTKYRARRI